MDADRKLWEEVFTEELDAVKQRRPDADEKNLVGLALSGGGIRSATFALGVLESLKNSGLLPKIDYLSTVSGGGYIGSWLSANCKQAADKGEKSWLESGADWAKSIMHLRRYSNYLAPTLGFFSADTWSVGAIWLRNTLLVQVTVILAIAVVLLIPRLLFPLFLYWPHVDKLRWLTIILFILGVVGISGNQWRLTQVAPPKFLKAASWLKGLAVGLLLISISYLIGHWYHFDPFAEGTIPVTPSVITALLLLAAGFCFQPVVVQLIKWIWPKIRKGEPVPQEINYTQAWAQAVVVLPMMITGFLVGAILWGQTTDLCSLLNEEDSFSGFFTQAWHYWPFPLAVVFMSLWLLSYFSIRDQWSKWGIITWLFAPVPAMAVLHALLSCIMLLLHVWLPETRDGDWLAYIVAPSLVLFAFSLTIVMLIGMLGNRSVEGVREWWSRFGAWLAIYGFAWLVISAASAYGPALAAKLIHLHLWGGPAATWIVTSAAGLFAGNSDSTGKSVTTGTRASILDVIAKVAPFVFIAGLLVLVSTGIYEIAVVKSVPQYLLFAACLTAMLILAWRVDINVFSLNNFYRSRLVRCYLGAARFRQNQRNPQNFTGFDDADDFPLAKLGTPGPFHIVNCALNLGGSKDLALHTRHSATFTLTPLRCGSSYDSHDSKGNNAELGYIKTSEFGGPTGEPLLGQAISVSGAAVSPNMGYHTSPVVAFMLTLFNVRLGWWFPNPAQVKVKSPSPWFSLSYLIQELFGGANDKASYLAISDGGHFENLAAYELIKRKCRVIIISDAECDPLLQFEGLGSLIRMCNVDFDAKIDLDVNALRPGDALWSKSRCAVGKITYQDGSDGTLIYFKASMTGQEPTDILQYKSAHASFPHESTGNQFYTEDQFESYRQLGCNIATQALSSVDHQQDFEILASMLEDAISPAIHDRSRFTFHSTRLMDLWSRLGKDQNLKYLDKEFTRGWPDPPADSFRSSFYICSEMIQLMESVYIDLRLEDTWGHPDNRGWCTTFQNWAASPAIKNTWQLTSESYGLRFRHFCKRRLGLDGVMAAGHS